MRTMIFIATGFCLAVPAMAEIASKSSEAGNDSLSGAQGEPTLTVKQKNAMLGASQLRCWQEGRQLLEERNVEPGGSARPAIEFVDKSTGRPFKLYELNETFCIYEGEKK